jgi:hypothetical protein
MSPLKVSYKDPAELRRRDRTARTRVRVQERQRAARQQCRARTLRPQSQQCLALCRRDHFRQGEEGGASHASLYIRNRGEGELAVQAAFTNAVIIRPAVMFGQDDAFLNTLVKLLKRLPAYPVFGRGVTRLQPVDVEDVAEAIARALQPDAPNPIAYELGGPRVYTYAELLRAVADRLGKRLILVSVPFPVWRSLARIAEMLPGSPLSRAQVDLMGVDTAASAGMPGFGALGITPQPVEHALEQILAQVES